MAMYLRQSIHLMQKELLLEWRQKHALGGIFLYLVSTIFICYLAFSGAMPAQTWNALFWIIMVFASVNLVLKSFSDETSGQKLYMYMLASPLAVILSRIVINTAVMLILGVLGYFFFSLFMGDVVVNKVAWWTVLVSGVAGFSSTLTMVSAIASQVKNNFTLMAVLGFPLILPLLLLLIKASSAAIAGLSTSEVLSDTLVILLLMAISLALSFLLFPYLWKE